MEETISIVLIVNEEEKLAKVCLKMIKQLYPKIPVIVVDNGSTDGFADWLSQEEYEFIYFDEGKQTYGKVINTVIEQMQLQEKILFMEPRYILIPQVLERLLDVLDKHSEIGMVSPNSNSLIHLEKEEEENLLTYQDLEKIAEKEKEEQIYFSLKLFQRIFLIRKELFTKVGMFEERLEEANNAVADYALELIQKDVKLAICKNAYVFDMKQGYSDERHSKHDRNVLVPKWGTTYINVIYNSELLSGITHNAQEAFSVLEVGCDLGATLLEIKNRYPNSRTYGLEINQQAVAVAKHIANVCTDNIEEKNISFSEKFDYIIFGDVLEHLHHPEEVLGYCKELLKDNGTIIASIPNIMHISVMEQLINGKFTYQDMGLLDETHIHFFTYYEMEGMFQRQGYQIEEVGSVQMKLSESQKELKQILSGLSENTKDFMYSTYQYIVRAVKK
ncbi:MAG: methyltransferase domain-containing protein [Lachnospiraceae bacterium]